VPFYLACDHCVYLGPTPAWWRVGAAWAGSPAEAASVAIPWIGARRNGRSASRYCPPRHGWPGAAAAWLTGACATLSMRSATSPITGRCGGRCLLTSRPPEPSTGGWITGGRTDRPGRCMHPPGPGRSPRPRAVTIDSQSVKGSEMIARAPPRLRRREGDQRDYAAPGP
jgi:hypothetical protein